jgi:hypothetical protein
MRIVIDLLYGITDYPAVLRSAADVLDEDDDTQQLMDGTIPIKLGEDVVGYLDIEDDE